MANTPDNIVPITNEARSAAREFGAARDRELLTILFTDLVDSAKLQFELGNIEAARLTELHRKIVRDELANYDAREIEWAGDSCLAVFSKPSDAVAFALRMQLEHLRARNNEPKLPQVRVGIHLGEVVVRQRDDGGKKTEDLFGLQVSEAARIMSVARGNQIFCSRAVYDSARGSLRGNPDLSETLWVRHGLYLLKGSDDPVEICEVGTAELGGTQAPEPTDKCAPFGDDGAVSRASTARITRVALFAVAGFVAVALVAYLLFMNRGTISPRTESAEGTTQADEQSAAPREPKPVKRSYLGLSVPPQFPDISITPDGSSIVYVTQSEAVNRTRLAVQDVGQLKGRILENTDSVSVPEVSPDGQSIVYHDWTDSEIKRIPVRGGTPVTITRALGTTPMQMRWFGDEIYYGNVGVPLFRVRATGGPAEQITRLRDTGGGGHSCPDVLPGGRGVLFRSFGGPDMADWDTFLIAGDEPPRLLIEGGHCARYIPSGHILYFNEDVAMVAPFDLDTLSIVGDAVPVNEEGLTTLYGFTNHGTMVYFAPTDPAREGVRTLAWVDMMGVETPIPVPAKQYGRVTISPDGERAVIGNSDDIWLLEFDGRAMLQRLTSGEPLDSAPIFADGGETIIFTSTRSGTAQLHEIPTKQTAVQTEPQQLTPQGPMRFADAFVQEGRQIIYTEMGDGTGFDIGMGRFDSDEDVYFQPVVQSPGNEGSVALSPDGRWVAYTTDEVEGGQIYVASFPSFEGKYPISVDGGTEPVWAPDGSAIYYRKYPAMMRVDVEAGETFRAEKPVEIFSNLRFLASPVGARMYDVHPDGDRFLMIVPEPESEQKDLYDLVVVENWFDELERIAPHPDAG